MSQEELLVTLGAKDSASTVIRKVNNELKYLDKEYKLTQQSSKGFDSSMSGLTTKLSMLEKKYEVNKIKLEAYKKQVETSNQAIIKKQQEIKKLSEAEGDNSKAIEKAEKQLAKYKDQMVNATRNINLTEIEMKNLNGSIEETQESINRFKVDKFKAKMDETAAKLKKTEEKFKSVGAGISKTGANLMKVGAPILAAAGYASNASMEFKDGIANINTLLDDPSHLEGYSAAVLNFSDDLNISAKIMNDGMYQTISSIGDMGKDTISMFGIMAKSAKAGGAEVSDSVALISAGMKGYNQINEETANKISDLAFETAKLGVTTFPEMAQSMKPLFPLANSLSISLEELFGVMATGTGVTGNTAEVSTQYKAVLSNLMKPTKQMAELLAEYNYESADALIKQKGFAGVIDLVKKETGGAASKMAGLFSSTEALTLMTALCGSQFDTLKEKTNAMNNSLGATSTAYDKIAGTDKNKLTSALNKLQNSFIRMGEASSPAIEGLADIIEQLTNALNGMDKETIASIVKLGAFSVALGGVGKVAGGVTSGVGSIIGMASKLTPKLGNMAEGLDEVSNSGNNVNTATLAVTKGFKLFNPTALGVAAAITAVAGTAYVFKKNSDVMAKSVTTTAEELTGLERTLLRLNGVEVRTKKDLQELGLVYKDFSSNISKDFQDKVVESTNKVNDFNIKLQEIGFDKAFSKEEAATFENDVRSICDSAIETIKSKSEESNKAIKDLFMSDEVITESEKTVIDYLSKTAETQITEVNKLKDEILAIEKKALEEKRILTDGEIKLIQEKRNKIAEIELQALGSNKEEIIYAQNEFNERIKRMDIESAKALLAEKSKIRDDEISKIAAGYNTRISIMESGLENAKGKEKKALEEQIEIAKGTRDKKIKMQKDLYEKYIEIINENNPKVLEEVDRWNGKELSIGDKKKKQEFQNLKSHYRDLYTVTEDGLYELYNKTTESWDKVVVKVDKATGEIIGVTKLRYDEFGIESDKITGANEEAWNSMDELQKKYVKSLNDISMAVTDGRKTVVTENNEIKNSLGVVVGKLDEVTTATDGTKKGILDLNGTPVKVEVNKEGAITNVKDILAAIEKVPTRKHVNIDLTASANFGKYVGENLAKLLDTALKVTGYAKGTKNATQGVHLVGEEGPELVLFNGGESVLTAKETRGVMIGGGYFSPASLESQELISTTNNYNNYSYSNSQTLGVDNLVDKLKEALAQVLQIDLTLVNQTKLDSKLISHETAKETIRLGKEKERRYERIGVN